MNTTTEKIAPALRALLERLIDYAGIYPPAALPLDTTVANYGSYQSGEFSWMLRWLVVGSAELQNVPNNLDGCISLLSETDDSRAATLETKGVVEAKHPVYCEIAISNLEQLDAAKASGCYAKIRTGGVKPEAIPSPKDVAAFIIACAERRLPFKATAGLHHPIRAEYALTYEADAPRAVMHGFLNVLMAAAFAWQGEKNIEAIIAETDASTFTFDGGAKWRGLALSYDAIKDARQNFMHSIGSCSFDEPIHELQALGLLPKTV